MIIIIKQLHKSHTHRNKRNFQNAGRRMHLLLAALVYKLCIINRSLAKSAEATLWFPGLDLLFKTAKRFLLFGGWGENSIS